jgi:NDP-sugar pyrophosphorylase family protein
MMDVTAAILCGGLGTRLREAVGDRPKFLADVGGRPFADFVLTAIAATGIRRAVLCTGYMGELVESVLGPSRAGIELVYSREDVPLGTGGALRKAMDAITTPLVLAANGDSYCDADLATLIGDHRARGGSATMLLARAEDARAFGRVAVDEDGTIARFDEKTGDPSPAWVNAGVYVVSATRLRAIPTGRAVSFEKDVLPAWIPGGLRGHRTSGSLLDIGTPETYRSAAEHMARTRR